MKCSCGSTEVYTDEGYETIYRCYGCGKVGNAQDFNI